MKLLLDENLPKKLKNDFPQHEVFTIRQINWAGIKNGQLMKLLVAKGFDALLTFDKNLPYQQNIPKYEITVFVLVAVINTYENLTVLSPLVNRYLDEIDLPKKSIIITTKQQ